MLRRGAVVMPELPQVEIYRQSVEAAALHETIDAVAVYNHDILERISFVDLRNSLMETRFCAVHRHGKVLFLIAENGWILVLDFSGAGIATCTDKAFQQPVGNCLDITFMNGQHFVYDCQRRAGRVMLAKSVEHFIEDHHIGPDALGTDFSAAYLCESLEKRRITAKSALMKQEVVAGIGPVYADEILFQAGVHPRHKAGDLKEQAVENIFWKIRYVLTAAVACAARHSVLPSGFLISDRSKGGSCPKCGGDLAWGMIACHSACWCESCQRY
ncbi:MAG TPA: DNA-formamidopyrimidine glycosylase family protein [Thermodesulfobacteriota bacterium]|nr:DNA-formamidopyrimidine glycosylase family protein [Thermodesulfobacteriota bacterium]HNU70764.1 DNA-formamidopyrimidine glycosylase family protein [Thermodesulfobacteriota bacterium]